MNKHLATILLISSHSSLFRFCLTSSLNKSILADAIKEAADASAALADAEKVLAESTSLGSISSAKTTDAINSAVKVATILGESASDIANAMMTGLVAQGVDTANAASTSSVLSFNCDGSALDDDLIKPIMGETQSACLLSSASILAIISTY